MQRLLPRTVNYVSRNKKRKERDERYGSDDYLGRGCRENVLAIILAVVRLCIIRMEFECISRDLSSSIKKSLAYIIKRLGLQSYITASLRN